LTATIAMNAETTTTPKGTKDGNFAAIASFAFFVMVRRGYGVLPMALVQT
jgi:hypothetical protein